MEEYRILVDAGKGQRLGKVISLLVEWPFCSEGPAREVAQKIKEIYPEYKVTVVKQLVLF